MTAAAAHPLAAMLAEVGWRSESLAASLNALASSHGRADRVHAKTPYKWLRGEHPRPPWPDLVAVLMTEHLRRPVSAAELGWRGGNTLILPATAGLTLPWTVGGSLRALHTMIEADHMHRRMFLTLLGATATTPALEWLVAHDAGAVGKATGDRVPVEVVDHLDDMAGQLRRLDDQLGGGKLLGLVREHLRTATDLLEDRRYTDTVGRRLHATAAELMRLAGWMSFDSGRHPEAQRYWTAALHAAHAAGDRALGANILGFMSNQAKEIGQVRSSVTMAEAALAGYPGASPRVGAILQLRAAQAYAHERNVDSCRRAVDAAFTQLAAAGPRADQAGSAGPAQGPAWSYWLDESMVEEQAGYCFLELGDASRARRHLGASLSLAPPEATRERALRRTLLATSYVTQGPPDLDRAAALGDQAVDVLTGQVDSTRCAGYVQRLVEATAPYRRNSSVRRFIEHAAVLSPN